MADVKRTPTGLYFVDGIEGYFTSISGAQYAASIAVVEDTPKRKPNGKAAS